KSILNRLMIIGSYSKQFEILGESDCDDVLEMQKALPLILEPQDEVVDCGAGGTTFRFLALRASRVPGRHVLTGRPELFVRPQEPLVDILTQLGAIVRLTHSALEIETVGWRMLNKAIRID